MEDTALFSKIIDIDVHHRITSKWVQKSMPLHANAALAASNNNASSYVVHKLLPLGSNTNHPRIVPQLVTGRVTYSN